MERPMNMGHIKQEAQIPAFFSWIM
uniref:Uncharacterized protein n=1 Tax=Rhizophora mucronata TaxID=61149 RepID=A0A2P2P6H3_RHIMU